MMYSPGGRRSLELTSRKLIKLSERAQDERRRKKSFFMWTAGRPWNCRTDIVKMWHREEVRERERERCREGRQGPGRLTHFIGNL